eukprot:9251795-Ditylum_brightwellii.AAC.1
MGFRVRGEQGNDLPGRKRDIRGGIELDLDSASVDKIMKYRKKLEGSNDEGIPGITYGIQLDLNQRVYLGILDDIAL